MTVLVFLPSMNRIVSPENIHLSELQVLIFLKGDTSVYT